MAATAIERRLSSITLSWFAVGRQVFAAEEDRDIVDIEAVEKIGGTH